MSIAEYKTAKASGFRMPAEWEPHERCWMQWPYRSGFVFPDIEKTQAAYVRVARAVRQFEPVCMVVCARNVENAREQCGEDIDYLVMELDDAWARDSGPNFVKNGNRLAVSVFHFNAWGQKYEKTRNDAAVGHRIAEHLGIPTFTANAFMEGGGINVDGQGTIITSETNILNDNRNPGLTKAEAEEILCESLGASKVIWIPGDPLDLETDGHVDGLACFTEPGKVLCETGNLDDPDRSKDLAENWRALELATDAAGNKLELSPIVEAHDAEELSERWCASYINFYIANGGIIAPEYGTATDAPAHAAIRDAFPDRELVTLDIDHIAIAGGGIHCITQQQPQ